MKCSVKILVVCLLLVFGVSCSVLRPQPLTPSDIQKINYRLQTRFRIDSRSMLPSIPQGTFLVINKEAYLQNPILRGDVIIFQHPSTTTTSSE